MACGKNIIFWLISKQPLGILTRNFTQLLSVYIHITQR